MSGPCCAADTRRPVDGTPLDRAFSYVRAAGEAASAGRPQRPLAQEIEMTYRDDTVRKTDELDGDGTAPENQEHATEAVGAGAGALAGAGVGMVVGGPVGAAVGGVIGAAGGAIAGEAADGDDEAGAGAGGAGGAIGGAIIGGAIAGPPGAVVGGAVGAGAGAGLGDQAQEEVEEDHPTHESEVPR